MDLKRHAMDYSKSERGRYLRSLRYANRSMYYTKRCQELARGRGHDAIFLELKNGVSKRKVKKLHICRKRLAHNGGHSGGAGSASWPKQRRGFSVHILVTMCPSRLGGVKLQNIMDWKQVASALNHLAETVEVLENLLGPGGPTPAN